MKKIFILYLFREHLVNIIYRFQIDGGTPAAVYEKLHNFALHFCQQMHFFRSNSSYIIKFLMETSTEAWISCNRNSYSVKDINSSWESAYRFHSLYLTRKFMNLSFNDYVNGNACKTVIIQKCVFIILNISVHLHLKISRI